MPIDRSRAFVTAAFRIFEVERFLRLILVGFVLDALKGRALVVGEHVALQPTPGVCDRVDDLNPKLS